MKESSIELQVERIEGVLVISLSGEVHGFEAQKFHESLWEATDGLDKFTLLDLEGLVYISSVGLRSILMVAKRLRESKAKFAVCSLSRRTKSLFRMAAFDKVIDVFESRSEAIEAIKKMGGGRTTFQSVFIQDADLFFHSFQGVSQVTAVFPNS